jgi:hypothetical protein
MLKGETDLVEPEAILALLEDGPKETGILVKWFKYSHAAVLERCNRMARSGAIQRLPHPDRRWALPSYQPDETMLERINRVQPVVTAKALRQQLAESVPKNVAPSWWVSAPQEGFSARAEQELPRMRISVAGRRGRSTSAEDNVGGPRR